MNDVDVDLLKLKVLIKSLEFSTAVSFSMLISMTFGLVCWEIIWFSFDMFEIGGVTVQFFSKMVQLSGSTWIIGLLGCAMIQSQWLQQSLAFWKFALLVSLLIMNQVMHLTASVCNIFCVLHYQSFAMKAFVILDKSIIAIFMQVMWIIIVVILHDYGSFYLIGIRPIGCIIQHMCLMHTSWIDIISGEKCMLICGV